MRIKTVRNALGLLIQFGSVLLWSGSGLSAEVNSLPQANPEKLFVLPIEMDFDSGADNGNAIITRLLPVNSIPLKENWRLINVALLVIADAPGGVPGSPGNPDSVSGPNVFGLGDFTDALLFSRTQPNGLTWGFGPIVSLPIASDDRLGSGKWSAGPAIRLAYNPGPWHFGVLAGNLSSFAGDADRADVNQLLIRGLVRRKLNKGWFLKYSPIITANWDAASDQRWLVPLGGGVGKSFKLFSKPATLAVEAYSNVIKPDGAPDSVFRIALTLPVPRAFR
jgi:hypothetical protein